MLPPIMQSLLIVQLFGYLTPLLLWLSRRKTSVNSGVGAWMCGEDMFDGRFSFLDLYGVLHSTPFDSSVLSFLP